ncbi:helix-turn-helix domain-containing protein [Sphingomonas bacterium]|uniref:helix-turn-helix domain-containing protein n=1 Tax=Sphingomonas bacterium TaxID=1895847 RepID=UPI0015760E87|nr:helix-turn-helix domain-containing protein [Sphingomonas bacterium]
MTRIVCPTAEDAGAWWMGLTLIGERIDGGQPFRARYREGGTAHGDATCFRSMRPGEFFDPDAASPGMMLTLERGTLTVEIVTLTGVELCLDRLTPGHCVVGFRGVSNPAFVIGYRAQGPARLIERPMSATDVDVAVASYRALLSAAVRLTYQLACLPASHRLYCELLRLEAARRARAETGLRAPTHAVLAQRLSTSRETVSREMNHLRRLGVIAGGQEIEVTNVGYLLSKAASAMDLFREDDVWASVGAYTALAGDR